MRHKQNTQNLSRFSSYYQATIRSLAKGLIERQRIVTTQLRAKLSRRLVEQLITMGKEIDSLAARRRAFSILGDHSLVHRLFTDIAPLFKERKGGYTRIIPYKKRRGDNALLVVLELTERKEAISPVKVKKDAEKKAVPAKAKDVKPEHKEVAPPEKEKHLKAKESSKVAKKGLGGLGKIFKPERGSL